MALTSFGIREKWLRMLIRVLPKFPDIFNNLTNKERMEEAQYQLGGVGIKQVSPIKEWGVGCGLIEKNAESNYVLTTLGKIIAEYDPQFEQQGTFWVMHYNLCINSFKPNYTDKSNDIWFYSKYANSFGVGTFTRDDVKACLKEYKKEGKEYSDSVIETMCMASLLETMAHTRIGNELGVLTIKDSAKKIYERREPIDSTIHSAIFAYMLYDWADFNERLTVNTAEFFNYGSVACLMAMEEEKFNSLLNIIHDRYAKKILWVSWIAGLNSVAFEKTLPPLSLLRAYYIEQETGKDPLECLQEGIELEQNAQHGDI